MVRPPKVRATSFLHKLWLSPTNALGHVVAQVLRAHGPFPVGSQLAPAQYYVLPDTFAWWFGAVTLGHVILVQPASVRGPMGRWTMAHELAHTRQHDVLGPTYLPLHGFCQAISALVHLLRPLPGYSPVHAYNPLERGFLCVPYDFLVTLRTGGPAPTLAKEVLSLLGVDHFECAPEVKTAGR